MTNQTPHGLAKLTVEDDITEIVEVTQTNTDILENELHENVTNITLASGFTGRIYAKKIGNMLEIFGTINSTSNHVAAKHVFTLPADYTPHPSLSIGNWQTVGVITGTKGMINALVLNTSTREVVISRGHGNGLAPKNGEEITLNSCKILLSN